MTLRTKVLINGAAFYLLAATSAFAGVDVQLNFGQPAPAGVVYANPYPVAYDPHHIHRDDRYWHDHRNERPHPAPAAHFPEREFRH